LKREITGFVPRIKIGQNVMVKILDRNSSKTLAAVAGMKNE